VHNEGEEAGEFAKDLERRRKAEQGLEKDLLTDVPLLYGSPTQYDWNNRGDPGITLARIHREELLRRNGVDAFKASGTRSEIRLPFERLTAALAFILFLLCAVARARP
jgi:hypothetical protein